jgi:hypothetical protein
MFEPYVLNGLVEARELTFRAVVKSASAVSSDNVEKELFSLIDKDSVCAEGIPNMKVEDRSLVTSSGKIVGVLKRRAHPPELSHKSRW